jgi:hypothetical protein
MSRPSTNEALERPEIQEIIKALKSRKESDQRKAQAALLSGGAPIIEALLGVLSELEERQRQIMKNVRVISFIFVVGLVSGLHAAGKTEASNGALFAMLVLSGFGGMFHRRGWASRLHRNLLVLLAQSNDVRLTGTLLDACCLLDGGARETVESELTRILPQLRASDSHLFTSQHLYLLNIQLQGKCLFWSDMNTQKANHMIAIMQAIGEIGDGKAIPIVQAIIDYKAPRPIQKHVQAAARECLEALNERAERESVGSRLLRAADSPVDDGDALLRPAHNSPTVPEQQLLRVPQTEQK